jgi:hypothetical protein
MGRRTLCAFATVVALAATTSCTGRDTAVTDCLANAMRPPIITAPDIGKFPADDQVLPSGSPLDLRGRTFDHSTVTGAAGIKVEPRSDGSRNDLCFAGGTFSTTLDEVTTIWGEPDTPPTTPNWHQRWGMIIDTPNATVVGATLRNTGDGISFAYDTASNWSVIGVRADGGDEYAEGAFIHDDCIENDAMQSGRIIDSKFDGCGVFLSSRDWAVDGHANTVEIDGTLVRLQAMYNSFHPVTDEHGMGYGYNRHGGFFKWAATAYPNPDGGGSPPKLVIRRSIFRSDDRAPYGGNENGNLALPPGTVCDHVVVVGWDAWEDRDRASWIDACGPVGTGEDANLRVGTVADWNQAVAAWDDAHPEI